MAIQQQVTEQIKQRLDIVEIVRQYVPHLRRAGRTWKACCPFHKEKTPSFTVDQDKGFYYCFGCQQGGDVLHFVMQMEHLTFHETVRKLADMAGIEYRPQETLSPLEQKHITMRKTLDFAKKLYHKNLLSAAGTEVRNYIKKRGLTKETTLKFELGFAPDSFSTLMRAAHANHYTDQQLKEAGVCTVSRYGLRDYFRNRLIFPILNQRGETVAFGGRVLGAGEPKYLNTPETILFSKSHILYGLNFAGPAIRKANRAVLLEGYMDVIACHQAGVEYTVAPLGTSLTPDHARLLKRYTDNVIVLFDPDAAGIKAALRGALILIEQGLFVKVASLSDGLDPDEYIAKYGKEAFEQILNQAQDLISFHTRLQLDSYPHPLQPQAKTAIINELVETLRTQPDPIVRREWIKYIAEQVQVDETLVLQRIRQIETAARRQQQRMQVLHTAPSPSGSLPQETFRPAEENLLSWLLRFPQYAAECEELAALYDSRTLASLLTIICRAAQENPAADGFVNRVCQLNPALSQQAIRLAVGQLPDDFQAQRDIASCKRTIEKEALQRQLNAVRQQIKNAGTGQVPAELLQQMTELQNKLKK